MPDATTTLIVLKSLAGNKPTALNPLQELLLPHFDLLLAFWISTWCVTAVVVCVIFWREYRAHRMKKT